MKKRAASQAIWVLIVGALTLIGLFFISTLFGKTKDISEDITDYRICKDGNRGIVQTRLEAFDWVIAEQGVRHCKTERVTVASGKEYETIAKKMALCWDEYLEGKEKIFETQDANYCAFCSVLEFEDKNKKLNQLSKYLNENKLKGSEKTYLEYLSEIKATGDDKENLYNLELENNVFIDTSKRLAILFVMYEDAYPGLTNQPRAPLTFLGGAIGAAGGSILGFYYLGLAALCTTIVGCAASIGLVAIGTGVGATSGYAIGSDRSADWRARVLVTEYDKEKLEQLRCTKLEGIDYLKIEKNENIFKR